MKKALVITAFILVAVAILLPFNEFSLPISQTCGAIEITTQKVYWLYDWLAIERPGGFITCVGAKTVVVYRAFDVSLVILFISTALFYASYSKK